MYAAASSLIEAIKYACGGDPLADPPVPTGTNWDMIPNGDWYKYGSGGVGGWGSLCGVPNGCLAVCNLMGLNAGSLKDQVMYYSSQTEFPIRGLHDLFLDPTYGWDTSFGPEPVPDDEVLAYTTAGSPLCHVSVSKWANAAGVILSDPTPYGTKHKTDRCAKVVAGIAAFTAEMINGATSDLVMPADTAACFDCHNTSATSVFPGQQGKMDCGHCHTQEAVIVGRRHPYHGGGMR